MNIEEINLLIEQIESMLLGKHIDDKMKCSSVELQKLQERFDFLAKNLNDSSEFLQNITFGNLDITPPDYDTLLNDSLRTMHLNLQYINTLAEKISNGDYSQQIYEFSMFSQPFKKMTEQLALREYKLKEQSILLTESVEFLKSIMDGISEWIIVTSVANNEILYINESAKEEFYSREDSPSCGVNCPVYTFIKNFNGEDTESHEYEHFCEIKQQIVQAKSFLIQWNENLAYVHRISDITEQRNELRNIENIAYKDELTLLYNRRFCMNTMDSLILENSEFTFCLIDVDGLKYANDTFGHNAGDLYLKTVAEELLKSVNGYSYVCRLGGDEFVIISQTDDEQAIYQSMRKVDHVLNQKEELFPMSISFGVSFISKFNKLDAKKIIENVDKKMYFQKKAKKACRE